MPALISELRFRNGADTGENAGVLCITPLQFVQVYPQRAFSGPCLWRVLHAGSFELKHLDLNKIPKFSHLKKEKKKETFLISNISGKKNGPHLTSNTMGRGKGVETLTLICIAFAFALYVWCMCIPKATWIVLISLHWNFHGKTTILCGTKWSKKCARDAIGMSENVGIYALSQENIRTCTKRGFH